FFTDCAAPELTTLSLHDALPILVGGVLVDTSWLGWRWCFFIGVPFALLAIVLLQRTLRLPTIRREAKIDFLGAFLIVAGVSALRSEEHTSELQSRENLVCRLLLE